MLYHVAPKMWNGIPLQIRQSVDNKTIMVERLILCAFIKEVHFKITCCSTSAL